MPGLSEISEEILAAAKEGDLAPFDTVRRRYLRQWAEITGNTAAIYATAFVQKPSALTSITNEDVRGFMGILRGSDKKKGLDLILHSPGGLPEAAEGIADYLHQHFAGRKIRVVVPYMAMSAATMLACAADSVVMGDHSSLGPVDPQLTVLSDGVPWTVAAHSIVGEFNYLLSRGPEFAGRWLEDALWRRHVARRDLAELEVRLATGWGEVVLARFGGMGFIDECARLIGMSKKLIHDCLLRRMLAGDPESEEKAIGLAEYLGNHDHFLSHRRRVSRAAALEKGMVVERLEDNEKEQDAVLSVFHALYLAFSDTRTVKIIENDAGRAFTRMSG